MPKTEIQKRKDYYQRLVAEETARAKKDKKYTDYLATLSELVALTDSIYSNNGVYTAQQYSTLLEKYNSLTEQGNDYLKSSGVTNRRQIVAELGRYIKKDADAIAAAEHKENGNLKDVIADGRRVVVKYKEGTKLKVLGNALSKRYAVKTSRGQVGFFTASSTPDMSENWRAVIDKYKNEFTPENQKRLEAFINSSQRQNALARAADFGDKYTMEEMIYAMNLEFKTSYTKEEQEAVRRQYAALDNIKKETMRIVKAQYINLMFDLDEQSRIDNKNVSVYVVAQALGCGEIIARAEPMVVVSGDRTIKGTFMETAQGSDFARVKRDDPLLKANRDSFKESAQFHKQYSDLCVIDYLCGNTDRHTHNMLYIFDESDPPKCIGVRGIDNDTSFPEVNYDSLAASNKDLPTAERIGAIDIGTAQMVMSLDVVTLKTMLRDSKLTDFEFAGLCQRLDKLKYAIEYGGIKVIENWETEFSYKDSKMENWAVNQIGADLKNIKAIEKNELYAEEINYADSAELTEEEKRKLSFRTIRSLEGKMRSTDTFYKGSAEFNKMRDKLYAVSEIVKQNGDAIAVADKESKDYRDFEKALGEFSQAAAEYVAKKKLQPLTSHGSKRLDLAKKMQDRVWEMAENMGMELDTVSKEDKEIKEEEGQLQ